MVAGIRRAPTAFMSGECRLHRDEPSVRKTGPFAGKPVAPPAATSQSTCPDTPVPARVRRPIFNRAKEET